MDETKYEAKCPNCGKTHYPYKKKPRTYCCTECYIKDRNPTGICPTCGEMFSYKKGRPQKYCSTACHPGRKRKPENYVTKQCPVCGKDFTYHKSWPTQTCSNECRYEYFHAGKRVETTCPECDKPFSYLKSWPRKYCSRECAGKHATGNLPNWRPAAYTATCEQCGKHFTTTPTATRGRFCCFACFTEWKRHNSPAGEDHPNWRGGYLPYYGANWHSQRRAARRRDNYTCQRCGITESELGKHLDVHHIRRFADFTDAKEANRLSNLFCLCNKCHAKVERETTRFGAP